MVRHVRAFAVAVLALAALGVAAGVVWSLLAPRTPYVLLEQGPVLADPSTQTLIAADGWYAVITGTLGLLCGAVAWRLARRRKVAALLGLTAGGTLAAFLALWVGTTFTFGAATVEAAANLAPGLQVVAGSLKLSAEGVIVAWPFLAVGLFGLLEGVVAYRESTARQPYDGLPL